MRELALFAGAGGGLLASRLLGWSTACAVELEPYARRVLLQRQAEGHLERFPIWDDVRTFDGNPWRGSVDIVSGGFPCQDISAAGKREGIAGESSGLVFEMLRIVDEVRPRFVFAENSTRLRTHGLGSIVSTLDRMGYDCAWGVLGAWHAGAPHRRDRLWLLAHADSKSNMEIEQGRRSRKERRNVDWEEASDAGWNGGVGRMVRRRAVPKAWKIEPEILRTVDGFPDRLDQLRAIGNGQVPQVAELAFRVLSETLGV